MAPISTSPVAPQSTRRIAHILPDSLEGSKQTAIYAAAIATLVLLFLFAGTYLLFLRRRRSHQSETVADAEGCTSSVTVKDTEGTLCVYGSDVHKAEDDSTTVRKPETLKPPVRSITDSRPSSLSEMEADRIRFLTFKFPPAQDRVEGDAHVASYTTGASEIQRTCDSHIAVQSAEVVPSLASETRPVEETRPRTRHDVDRGESTLNRLDDIITQEPSFVVPEVLKSLPPVAVDPMRHGRVLGMLDDILAQEPPPLSPVSESSDANSLDSRDPSTQMDPTKDQDVNVLPPIGLAQLPQLPADEPRTVVLVEASPRLTQRYFVHPVLHTWSKLTGQADVPLVSHPAIVVEDTGIGELPMQSPADFSLFELKTSPEIEYLSPSWNTPYLEDEWEEEEEEWEDVVIKPPPTELRPASPRPTGICWTNAPNALGLLDFLKIASDGQDLSAEVVVSSRDNPVQYGYF